MKYSYLAFLYVFAILCLTAFANDLTLSGYDAQRCSGMYDRQAWGGSISPFISVEFENHNTSADPNPIASLLIFEWADKRFIGKLPSDNEFSKKVFICNAAAISRGLCESAHQHEFIIDDNAANKSHNLILTQAIPLNSPPHIHYPVERTGYYCVETSSMADYTAKVVFRNSYGLLPGAQIAKLPFYGTLTIVYMVICAFWGFLYYQYHHDILPVQNYITATLVFLVVEMFTTWAFYDVSNRYDSPAISNVLLFLVAILNAGRNSFSFFLLLIVCMGYGIVNPSLGRTMIMVRWLACTHFIFGVIYSVTALLVHPEDVGILVLLVVLPLSATLTAFYIWTLNSLTSSIKDLTARKQYVKANMFRKLWWCIIASVLIIFGFFFFNAFDFADISDEDFTPTHWQSRWFVLDGWLNLVYLVDICFISFLWRPTANNRRFAMSNELAQDDEHGFEIASLCSSLDDDDDHHSRTRRANSETASASNLSAGPPSNANLATSTSATTKFTDEPTVKLKSVSSSPTKRHRYAATSSTADDAGSTSPVENNTEDEETLFVVGDGEVKTSSSSSSSSIVNFSSEK